MSTDWTLYPMTLLYCQLQLALVPVDGCVCRAVTCRLIAERSSRNSLRICIGLTMPVCVNCRLAKPGVKLCADDLLCPECFQDNERQLAELKKQNSTSQAVAQESLTAPAELTNKTRASRTRQSRAKIILQKTRLPQTRFQMPMLSYQNNIRLQLNQLSRQIQLPCSPCYQLQCHRLH